MLSKFNQYKPILLIYLLYKVVQRFGVTCLFTGQYDTALLWHITDVISRSFQYYQTYCLSLQGAMLIGHI